MFKKKSVQSVYWASKLVLFPLPFLVTIKWTHIFLIRKLNGLRENYLNVGHLCKTSPYKTAVVLCPIYNRLACYYRITFILVLCSYSCLFHIFKEEKKKHQIISGKMVMNLNGNNKQHKSQVDI